MKLNRKDLLERENWRSKGYKIPSYDIDLIIDNTEREPEWVHFGAGNIFRCFPLRLQNSLIERGLSDKGIVVAEGFDYEIIDKIYKSHDSLSLIVTLKCDGKIEKEVIASAAKALKCSDEFKSDFALLKSIFENPSLQIATFTITEKGYQLKNAKGDFFEAYLEDFKRGPSGSEMFMSKLVELLWIRYRKNRSPIALLSLDNCSNNGDKLRDGVQTIAAEWEKNGKVDKGFVDYLNGKDVSYPISMIDKITPRPDESVKRMLEKDGFEDTELVITDKKTFIAPFVNSEEAEYLVVEDNFPNGRPRLEEAGVYFTDRNTVEKVEKMKVGTCLNPLHTALALFGCLLGYKKISDEMKDEDLLRLIKILGYNEGLKVVEDPKIISPKAFIDEVIEIRLPNPFMPDTPERIATDTSQKLSVRFGGTIRAYMEKGLDAKELKAIPLVFAAWLRYLMALNDSLERIELSPDPLLEYAKNQIKGISIGYSGDFSQLRGILSNDKIFGVDLYKAGLAERVIGYFKSMIQKEKSVRETLRNFLKAYK